MIVWQKRPTKCLHKIVPRVHRKNNRLVSEALPPDDLLPRAYELAREIVENTSPVSVALTRQMLWRLSAMDHPRAANDIESKGIQWATQKGVDLQEGIMAFIAPPPSFR